MAQYRAPFRDPDYRPDIAMFMRQAVNRLGLVNRLLDSICSVVMCNMCENAAEADSWPHKKIDGFGFANRGMGAGKSGNFAWTRSGIFGFCFCGPAPEIGDWNRFQGNREFFSSTGIFYSNSGWMCFSKNIFRVQGLAMTKCFFSFNQGFLSHKLRNHKLNKRHFLRL